MKTIQALVIVGAGFEPARPFHSPLPLRERIKVRGISIIGIIFGVILAYFSLVKIEGGSHAKQR